MPVFNSLAFDLVVFLLGVSRESSKESRRTFLIPILVGVKDYFDISWCLRTSTEQYAIFMSQAVDLELFSGR